MPNKHVKKCNQNYVIRNTFCSKYPNRYFPYWKILFLSSIFKKLLLRNYVVDFVEICNFCARKAIIEAAKRIINSDKVCHSYSDLNFGVTFFGTQCRFLGRMFWQCRSNFDYLNVIGPKATEFYKITQITAITRFKVILGHQF